MSAPMHPCFGPEHAKEHDDRWCTDCDRAWMGDDWRAEQEGKDRERLAAAVAEYLARDVIESADRIGSLATPRWIADQIRALAARPAELLARAEAVAKEKDRG